LTDFQTFFTGTFCEKFVVVSYQTYYHTLTASLHYLVKYQMCEIN